MRRFPKRPDLPQNVLKKLTAETVAITSHTAPKLEAKRRYENARIANWFRPLIKELQVLSGPGQRCMLCSGSEASDVEHYRPKSIFPELVLTWENFLWSCTPCNRGKHNRFPPITETGGRFINPLDEDVWDFFFIDEFGLLTPCYDVSIGALNERAVTTRDFLDLNREAVQESRKMRLDDLRSQIAVTLRLLSLGQLSKDQVHEKIANWRKQPFQPDVADYFLNGPGMIESPFKNLFDALLIP